MTNPVEQSGEALPRWRVQFWPGLVIGLLVGKMLFMTVMVIVATRDRSFAVEPDYYQKAVAWDEHAAQQQANERLAWQAEITLGDQVSPIGERDLICTLSNRDGQKLDGAQVEVLVFPHARGVQRTTLTLSGQGAGRYVAKTRFHRKGLWEFQLRITRGPEIFTKVVQRDVYPPGESRPWRR